jgi:hypothetical protein
MTQPDHPKMLVVVLSGPENWTNARQGIVFALNADRAGMLSSVELLFFGSGVKLLESGFPQAREFKLLLDECRSEGLIPHACSGNMAEFKLLDRGKELNLDPVGAQTYIPAKIREGYQVITF